MTTATLADRRALPVGAVPGEPDAYRRFRALNLADAKRWLRFMWVIDAATTDPNALTYAIDVHGTRLTLAAPQVLPFVFGLAVGHGQRRDATYRDGLTGDRPTRSGTLVVAPSGTHDQPTIALNLGGVPGELTYAIDACGLLLLPTAAELGPMLHGVTIATTFGVMPPRTLGPAIDAPAPATTESKGRRRK